MQNEKELKFACGASCLRGANYPSQERAILPAARTTLQPGWFNFACGANYPHPGTKRGAILYLCGE
jgi:hypothetical protein